MASVAVVGAGIMGLSSARLIAQLKPEVKEVVIYSRDFSPMTTSDGAGGEFLLFLNIIFTDLSRSDWVLKRL